MHSIVVTSWRQTNEEVFHFPFSESGCFPKVPKVLLDSLEPNDLMALARSNQRIALQLSASFSTKMVKKDTADCE